MHHTLNTDVSGSVQGASALLERGNEILSHARRAFVEKGFDGASMQDLARAVGMSAGNFYRYFPSKAAIIEALVARELARVEDAFRAISSSEDPVTVAKAAVREEITKNCAGGGDYLLWAEICAAAAHKPEVAATLGAMEDRIASRIAQVIGIAGGLSEVEARRRFGAQSRLIFLIMHGALTAPVAYHRPLDGELLALVVQTINRIFDDALAEVKGH